VIAELLQDGGRLPRRASVSRWPHGFLRFPPLQVKILPALAGPVFLAGGKVLVNKAVPRHFLNVLIAFSKFS
jgi:hypothetical protein